jgi:CRP/FNR family transcriptional regulator, cyclic AMP receptor protein
MEPTATNRTIIRYVKAFSSLSDGECDALLSCMQERQLSTNEILFRQGEEGDTMMIVHHGALSVRARRPDGLDAEIAVVQGGEVLGEMCVIDPAPRSATVLATAPTMVCELRRDDIARLRETAPGVYAAVMGAVIRDITRRFRDVDTKVSELIGAKPSTRPPPPMRSSPPPPVESAAGSIRRFIDRLRGLS